MLYNYIALFLFFLFALLVPILFLLFSMLIREKSRANKIKNAPYESAEESIGSARDIENEYLPYFTIFLPFELIIIFLFIWAPNLKLIDQSNNIILIGLLIVAMFLSAVIYKIITRVKQYQ
ncbi:MAG: NADH-quinone oxidoreductase subunit A [Candidatus Micrarchaeia archaeon]